MAIAALHEHLSPSGRRHSAKAGESPRGQAEEKWLALPLIRPITGTVSAWTSTRRQVPVWSGCSWTEQDARSPKSQADREGVISSTHASASSSSRPSQPSQRTRFSKATSATDVRGREALKPLDMSRTLSTSVPSRVLDGSPHGSKMLAPSSDAPPPPNYLCGLTKTIKAHNDRAQGLQTFLMKEPPGRRTQTFGALSEKNQDSSINLAMVDTMEELSSKIGELRAQHDAFEPGVDRHGLGGTQSRRNENKTMSDEKRERLEAYKLVRKISEELPPLRPLASLPALPPKDTMVMRRNASVGEMRHWSPEARQQRLGLQRMQREAKYKEVIATRDNELIRLEGQYADELARKRMQAERALADRNPQRRRLKKDDKMEDADAVKRWLTFVAVTSFLRNAYVDLKTDIRKMTKEDLLVDRGELVDALSQSRSRHRKEKAETLARTLDLYHLFQDAQRSRKLLVLATWWRTKLLVKQTRTSASLIFHAMKKWGTGGAIIINKVRWTNAKVKLLQHWWRRVSRRLKELRDKVSMRWVVLEREQIKVEGRHCKTIDEATRLRFIENELKARRFFLLPWIRLWEEEKRRMDEATIGWKAKLTNRQRRVAVAKDCTAVFTECSACPSYMPPAHPSAEAMWGAPCRPNCVGRRGDQEILDMWRRCQASEKSSLRIQRRGTKKLLVESRASVEEAPPGEQAGLFGPLPSEEECERWGVDTKELPGLEA